MCPHTIKAVGKKEKLVYTVRLGTVCAARTALVSFTRLGAQGWVKYCVRNEAGVATEERSFPAKVASGSAPSCGYRV